MCGVGAPSPVLAVAALRLCGAGSSISVSASLFICCGRGGISSGILLCVVFGLCGTAYGFSSWYPLCECLYGLIVCGVCVGEEGYGVYLCVAFDWVDAWRYAMCCTEVLGGGCCALVVCVLCVSAWGACRCGWTTSFTVDSAALLFGVARPSPGCLSLFIASMAPGFFTLTSVVPTGRCFGDGGGAALSLSTPCGLVGVPLGDSQGVFGLDL